ncbi:MAG: hypothetical protein IT581_21825 [Verrucomicrobiales bacterium]|nr:hypothetical protein [Verrucomicrobiales bacterium]
MAGTCSGAAEPGPDYREFNRPPHDYFSRKPTDRFARLRPKLESATATLPVDTEVHFLTALLGLLEVPVSSQMLVFSTTSLQLSRITPTNPRALYFNDEVYLGFIPGGKIEVLALDRDLGAVFYIFDIPRGAATAAPIQVERATRCMNCHAGDDTGHVPGLVVKSVVSGPNGGSLDSFRREQSGHEIPLQERFGGWYLTDIGDWTNHWGNTMGRLSDGEVLRLPNRPEDKVAWDRYPRRTSNLLPQLLHEHQAGFVNRVVEAAYRTRTIVRISGHALTPDQDRELDQQADRVVRYLLFAEEASLSPAAIRSDEAFIEDFRRNRREVGGRSLKDLDVRARLLRYRCSYMIYSPVFDGLPEVIKKKVYVRLARALKPGRDDAAASHLDDDEKRAIREILLGTLNDLPNGW